MARNSFSSWIAEVITEAIIAVVSAATIALAKYAYKSAAKQIRKRKDKR